ncbi:RNA methyltransferase [Chamaesiphon sp. VAR_48_metabat_135_sub]|uniref:TrmH family RNA methyltransferase n=1 Tax=Chamaesiphon sp. VAR_48_metabat_135_sub TaxID=2964699 RepID=UPI00286A5D4A|nr:RNA methyltransferase [Chamaesiphon sp. VAR_48_metabat_135_sub]
MLTSIQNPLVQKFRRLQNAKERRETQLFLLEGTHLIQEACAVNYPLMTVCYTSKWEEHHPELRSIVLENCDRVELVSDEVIKSIATTVNPDGIVAIAPRLAQKKPPIPAKLTIVLSTIQDPGNLGTIIRTAAAAGADGLWVSQDSVDLDNPKVLRASAGQWFRLAMGVSDNLHELVTSYQQQGVQIVSTTSHTQTSYWDVNLTKPTLILLGNEGAGLSDDLAALADLQVKIPMETGVESLNVATAAALMLYEVRRQRS